MRALEKNEVAAAVTLCAQAMLDNPIHVRVFGKSRALRLRRLQRFFSGLLNYVHRKGTLMGAFVDGALVGVIGVLPPKQCKPSWLDAMRLLPTLTTSTSPLGTVRLAIWLSTWARLDPNIPHWHVGPLAVDPAWQRHGIGTQLMQWACRLNTESALYLETDKKSNVELYKRFGFSTVTTPVILGVPSWVMLRPH